MDHLDVIPLQQIENLWQKKLSIHLFRARRGTNRWKTCCSIEQISPNIGNFQMHRIVEKKSQIQLKYVDYPVACTEEKYKDIG